MAEPNRSLSSFGYPHSQFIDDQQWLDIVRKSIEQGSSKSSNKVSIFVVPKTLIYIAPNCYTPQHVALGPNHYWRPELHDMEGYKIEAAKGVQQRLRSENLSFEGLVKQFMNDFEADIRACYQRFIYFNGYTLAWVMAVDTAFLLEFLQVIYAINVNERPENIGLPATHVHDSAGSSKDDILYVDEDKVRLKDHSIIPPYMFDYERSTSSRNAIVRDIVMLENQIPLFLVREMLKVQSSLSEESANSKLFLMLKAICKEVCPLKFMADSPKTEVSKRAHLLDYMYHMILPNVEEASATENKTKIEDQDDKSKEVSFQNASHIINLLSKIKNLIFRLKLPKKLQSIFKLITLVVKIPWNFIHKEGNEGSSSGENNDTYKAPEIAIPSATGLLRAGSNFQPLKEVNSLTSLLLMPKELD